MNYAYQTQEWQSMLPPKRPRARRMNSDTRRRQEEDIDDRPMMPVRFSAIVETDDANNMIPMTDVYPTLSNLERNGLVGVGLPMKTTTIRQNIVNDNRKPPPTHISSHERVGYEQQQQHYHQLPSPPRRQSQVARIPPDWNTGLPFVAHDNRGAAAAIHHRAGQKPQTVTVPQRGVRRCLSGITMSSDLVSFAGSEFAAIPPADDYMDDDQLQEYLDQLAKEEDRKTRERESLKNDLFAASAVNTRERESLKQLLQQLDCGAGATNEEEYEAYLNRLVEEQIQAEEQCMSSVARRVSDVSI